jgi:hypothetical protein
MFHLELRQFPHTARVFNLERAELDEKFIRPWVRGEMIDHDDRRWPPERTKMRVLEGPELAQADMGMGRGWGNVTKTSQEVTDTVIAEAERGAQARPEVEALKVAVQEVAVRPVGFTDVIDLAVIGHPGWRASEQLSLAEQAVWELLHQGLLTMLADGRPVPREGWQDVVLDWATWSAPAHEGAHTLQVSTGD